MHSLSVTRLDPWSHAPANLTIDANLPVKDLTLWCLRSTKTRPKKQDLSVMRLVCLLYNLSVTRQGCYSFWLVNPDLTKKKDLHDMTLVCLQQQPVHSKTGLLLLSVLSTQNWPRNKTCLSWDLSAFSNNLSSTRQGCVSYIFCHAIPFA